MNAIESSVDVSIRLSVTGVTAICPVDGHTDVYDVTVEYRPDGQLLELSSVADWFDALSDTEITQEALADQTARTVRQTANPDTFTVTIEGDHYGVETVVQAP